MKNILKILYSILLLFVVISCNEEQGETTIKEKGLQFYSKSGCKSSASLVPSSEKGEFSLQKAFPMAEKEMIAYEGTKDNCLLLSHVSARFCCESNVQVEVSIVDHEVVINYIERDPMSECICPFDLVMKVGPLLKGDYSITICYDKNQYARFSVKYTSSVKDIYIINK